jgi:hypothetical protein
MCFAGTPGTGWPRSIPVRIIQQRPWRGPPGLGGSYNRLKVWWRGRVVVALDGSGLRGAVLSRGITRVEARALDRVPLDLAALVPSPTEPNLVRPDAVQAALDQVLERLGRPARATFVLPLGVARMSLLDIPTGTDPRDYGRFRLGPTLGFPPDEAIVDVLSLGTRMLGAAVRRPIVTEYEKLAEDCGVGLDRVDLMPFPALASGRRELAAGRIDVFLGDAAFAVAHWQAGELSAFHTRWRGPGEGEDRIGRLVERLARSSSGAVAPRVMVVGEGSTAVAEALRLRGQPAEPGPEATLLGAAA